MAAKLKILVIDDNDRDAELLKRKLEEKFELTFVQTREAALENLKSNSYAAVFVDLELPNGRKDEMLDDVRKVCGDAVAIVLTGDTNPRTRDHMIHRKADNFVVKGKEDSKADLEIVIFDSIRNKKSKRK